MERVGGLVVLSTVGAPAKEAWMLDAYTCVPGPAVYLEDGARVWPGCAREGRGVDIYPLLSRSSAELLLCGKTRRRLASAYSAKTVSTGGALGLVQVIIFKLQLAALVEQYMTRLCRSGQYGCVLGSPGAHM